MKPWFLLPLLLVACTKPQAIRCTTSVECGDQSCVSSLCMDPSVGRPGPVRRVIDPSAIDVEQSTSQPTLCFHTSASKKYVLQFSPPEIQNIQAAYLVISVPNVSNSNMISFSVSSMRTGGASHRVSRSTISTTTVQTPGSFRVDVTHSVQRGISQFQVDIDAQPHSSFSNTVCGIQVQLEIFSLHL